MSRAHTHGMSNILAVMLTRPQPPKPRPKPSTVYLAKHLEISSNIDMFHQGWGLSPGMYIEWGFLSGGYNLGFNLRGGISRGLSPAFDIWSNNIYGLLVGILELWSRRALSERKPPPRQLYNPNPGVTWCLSPPKSNQFLLLAQCTAPKNFIQIPQQSFKFSCYQRDNQTNRKTPSTIYPPRQR